jgi:hypothetical protein
MDRPVVVILTGGFFTAARRILAQGYESQNCLRALCAKVGTGFAQKQCDHSRSKSIVRKSGYRFCAKTMRPLKTLERFCVSD